jgi:hypothetical protein
VLIRRRGFAFARPDAPVGLGDRGGVVDDRIRESFRSSVATSQVHRVDGRHRRLATRD